MTDLETIDLQARADALLDKLATEGPSDHIHAASAIVQQGIAYVGLFTGKTDQAVWFSRDELIAFMGQLQAVIDSGGLEV